VELNGSAREIAARVAADVRGREARRTPTAPGEAPDGWCARVRDGGPALLALLVVAAVLRIVALNQQLWLDETLLLADYVRQPVTKSATAYPNDNNHPLYSLAASLSARVCGEEAWALRLPAVLFGLASLAALYALARRFLPRGAAWCAAAAAAVSYHHVFFSQNARGYTALFFFTLLSTDAFLRARDGERRAPLVQALALGFGAWSHLTGVFVGLGQAAAQLLAPGRGGRFVRGPWAGILGGGAVTLLLHAPMARDLWTFFAGRDDRAATASEWTNPLSQLRAAAEGFGVGGTAAAVVAGALGLSVGAAGLGALWLRDRGAALAFTLPGMLGGAATLALGRHLWPRFFFFCAGFALIVLVAGLRTWIAILAGRRAAAATRGLAATLLVASAATVPSAWRPKQDFVGAVAAAARGDVDAPRGEVFAAGLAMWPCKHLYAPRFTPLALGDGDKPLDDDAPLRAALARNRAETRVLTCSPVFLRSRTPKIAALLEAECVEEARFRGTMGRELDLVVLRPR